MDLNFHFFVPTDGGLLLLKSVTGRPPRGRNLNPSLTDDRCFSNTRLLVFTEDFGTPNKETKVHLNVDSVRFVYFYWSLSKTFEWCSSFL